MNYLKGLLDGPAASTIAGLALSSASYSIAVKLLHAHARFGNCQLVINSHMESLLKLSCGRPWLISRQLEWFMT